MNELKHSWNRDFGISLESEIKHSDIAKHGFSINLIRVEYRFGKIAMLFTTSSWKISNKWLTNVQKGWI